jgi:sugar phosphate isomerase/epimerase
LAYVAVRNEGDQEKLNGMLDKRLEKRKKFAERTSIVVGGDIAFSYPFDPDTQVYMKNLEKMKETLDAVKRMSLDWVLIFTKEANFGRDKGIQIKGSKVKVSTLDGEFLELDLGIIIKILFKIYIFDLYLYFIFRQCRLRNLESF